MKYHLSFLSKGMRFLFSLLIYSKEGMMALREVSPLTGIFEEDKVYIDFGEHEGKSILEISDTFPDFYCELIEKKELGHCVIRRSKDKSYRLNISNMLN